MQTEDERILHIPLPTRHEDDASISVSLLTSVENARELKQLVTSGKLRATLLKPQLVPGLLPVVAAATKAWIASKSGKMVTRNLCSELILSLSPSKNIRDSLVKFGIGDEDDKVLLVAFRDVNGPSMEKMIGEIVKGTPEGLPSSLHRLCDHEMISKMYKIREHELEGSSIEDCVVSRVASKEFVTV